MLAHYFCSAQNCFSYVMMIYHRIKIWNIVYYSVLLNGKTSLKTYYIQSNFSKSFFLWHFKIHIGTQAMYTTIFVVCQIQDYTFFFWSHIFSFRCLLKKKYMQPLKILNTIIWKVIHAALCIYHKLLYIL